MCWNHCNKKIMQTRLLLFFLGGVVLPHPRFITLWYDTRSCQYHKCISFKKFIFCLSIDVKLKFLELSSVKIYSFEKSIVQDTGRVLCHFKRAVSLELDTVKFH